MSRRGQGEGIIGINITYSGAGTVAMVYYLDPLFDYQDLYLHMEYHFIYIYTIQSLHAIVACKRLGCINLNTVASPKRFLNQPLAATIRSLVKVAHAATCPAIGNVRKGTILIVVAVRRPSI